MRHRSWTAPAALAILISASVLAGCATPADVEPAPSASDPVCAEVLRALPETLAGQERRSTTTQASRAWGDPAITLRCGVTPPGPTTEQCLAVAWDQGAVDWLVVEPAELPDGHPGSAADRAAHVWTFTTYGRSPAVEVTVPIVYAGDAASSLLAELGPAVALVDQTSSCS